MTRTLPAVALLLAAGPAPAADRKPNVVVFSVDDMGYADLGCYGGKLAPTPHCDALARNGVRFTDGYVSACVCSPSRVGLMTGRYQARTGHDANSGRPGNELLRTETTMAERLKAAGYATGIVGKWHLGEGKEFLPGSRGFDHGYGSLDNLNEKGGPADFYRGAEVVKPPAEAPVTSPLYAREACAFIDAHKAKPFLLYLAFNAVHAPRVASEEWLKKFPDLKAHQRDYAACLAECDAAVGAVMDKLRALKLEGDTLVFLISDNGGSSPFANLDGLRGRKWVLWEGGVRVPFVVQWKGRIPAGRVLNTPVIQLDVLPTALAAAGAAVKPEWKLDGVNLLPLLEGEAKGLDRDALYWRFGVQYAVRRGDWKLVSAAKDMKPVLVNLAEDRGEAKDLTAQHPEKAKELQALWDKWNAGNVPPRWTDRRWDGEEARKKMKDDGDGP
ncbi:MAG: sulfatase [Isosphaera sp.]|nr:sulfatase [Isosphaera sp.]